MSRSFRTLLLLLGAAFAVAGGPGMRALHLGVEASGKAACVAADLHEPAGTDDRPPEHDEAHCATCELILGLVGTAGPRLTPPSFHALVAMEQAIVPERTPVPAPIPALGARPPPVA